MTHTSRCTSADADACVLRGGLAPLAAGGTEGAALRVMTGTRGEKEIHQYRSFSRASRGVHDHVAMSPPASSGVRARILPPQPVHTGMR